MWWTKLTRILGILDQVLVDPPHKNFTHPAVQFIDGGSRVLVAYLENHEMYVSVPNLILTGRLTDLQCLL